MMITVDTAAILDETYFVSKFDIFTYMFYYILDIINTQAYKISYFQSNIYKQIEARFVKSE